MAVSAADVYRCENSDGSLSFASQALNTCYTLYLKGEAETASPIVNTHQTASRSPRQALVEPLIQQFAQKHAVDAALVRAIIDVESRFNSKAISVKGAVGLMQLTQATAARYGVTDRTDPAQNIEAGVRYLKDLLTLHNGNITLALASYNAGEGAVAKYGQRIPPYKETMRYVPAVFTRLQTGRDIPTP